MTKIKSFNPLRGRNKEILECIASGDSYGDIHVKLKISVNTVSGHVQYMKNKFDKKTLPQLIAWAVENEYIEKRPPA